MKSPILTPDIIMPIIRIAPICNGKVYIIPHSTLQKMDLPLMGQMDESSVNKSNKLAKQLMQRYNAEIQTNEHPRFCVKYNSPIHEGEKVYLYILPLNNEEDIQFENGGFIDTDNIETNPFQYSHYLQKESGLLSMAAELWQDYL